MKLTKGTLRRIIKEESRRLTEKEEYKQFFKRALEKAGKSIPQMSDSEKKEFFNKIDAAWNARGEKNESVVSEGKKRFYQQDGIGKAKYTISYHDGKEKHKDGSDFYGIKTFRNKQDLEKFRAELLKKGYREDSGYKKESVNEARTVSKPIKVDNETMVQIVGDNKGFRELTAALNPKTGKPIQKFGYDRGNEIANSKEELVKKLQKKYGKSIKFESVVSEKKVPKKGSADYHQHKIAVDTVRNPIKSFMGGPSWKEAEETLIKKFGYSKKEVDKLRESVNEAKSQDPTLKEMVKFLKSNYRDEEEFSILLAIYFYSEANYGGMRSNLYSALSQLSNKMRVRTKFSDERGTEIEMMVDDLVDEFGGERP